MLTTIGRALADSQLDPLDARVLLRHVLGADDAYLITHAEKPMLETQNDLFCALAKRRREGEPVAYITGTREFFSLAFKVTPAVLIPRPETELLVEFALEYIVPEHAARVLDLGTGSGCIAISIAQQRPRAQIVAVDASAEALAVACENAQRLLGGLSKTPSSSIGRNWNTPSPLTGEGWDGGASAMLESSTPTLTLPRRGGGDLNLWFVRSDWLSALAGHQFDLIVANPPYVAAGDPHLAGELRFEPQSALVAGADGLDCIRLIISAARQHLNSGGRLAFEHGYDQSARCRELLAGAGFTRVFSRTDLAGIERLSGGQLDARP